MTSQEIKEQIDKNIDPDRIVALEIAYQLAISNELKRTELRMREASRERPSYGAW